MAVIKIRNMLGFMKPRINGYLGSKERKDVMILMVTVNGGQRSLDFSQIKNFFLSITWGQSFNLHSLQILKTC